jgi:hypothetical protein
MAPTIMAAKAELTVAAIVVNIQGSAKVCKRWNALISADEVDEAAA